MPESILNSNQAVSVLHRLALEEEGSYTSKVAKELDKPVNSISNTIRELYRKGLINEGKRTKARYYTISPEGLADYWIEQIKDNYENLDYNELNYDAEKGFKERYNHFKDEEDSIKDFLQEFIPLILQSYNPNTNATLGDLLFESVGKTILDIENSRPDKLKEENHLKLIPLAVQDFKGTYSFTPEALEVIDPDYNFTGYVEHNEDTEHK